MKSIITTYPDFQALPRAVKAMLLNSESHFFDEANLPKGKERGNVPNPTFGLPTDITIQIQSAGYWS
jgi:hypothetical protein